MKRLVLFFLVALLCFAAPVVAQTTIEPPVYSPEGCVVTTGLPAAPILQKAGGGVLSFTFNSPQQPWAESDLDSLNLWILLFYPVMEEIYGPPASTKTVNVRLDSTIQYAGFYLDGEIVLHHAELDVLVHETAHAFHSPFTMAKMEEAMARAVEVEVMNEIPRPYWNKYHKYGYDVWYEQLNQPEIGGPITQYFTLLKYQLLGYGVWKIEAQSPGFLRRFNQTLYGDSGNVGIGDRLFRKIARMHITAVEGLPFDEWYEKQYVFSSTPPTGEFIYQRVVAFDFAHFARDLNNEYPIPYQEFNWSVMDWTGSPFDTGTVVTNDFGYARLDASVPVSYPGRISVVVSNESMSDTAYGYVSSIWSRGVFGIIRGLDSGTVEVTCLDSSITASATFTLVNGGFMIPELQPVRGRFKIKVTASDGRYWIRYFNKDASSYFVLVDGPIIRSTQVAEIPPSAPRGFYLAQNYPNPFNPITTIIFDIPEKSRATLSVYNLTGQKVAVLVDGDVEVGQHRVSWNATNQPSGVYFYRIESGSFQAMKKMIMIR